jgi:hypothetical protein
MVNEYLGKSPYKKFSYEISEVIKKLSICYVMGNFLVVSGRKLALIPIGNRPGPGVSGRFLQNHLDKQLFTIMVLRMMLCSMLCMLFCVQVMRVRHVCMVCPFVMLACFIVSGCYKMVLGRFFMMHCCMSVMFCMFF